MSKFTIKVVQYVEEIAEIEVEAFQLDEAKAIVKDSIQRNMLDEEFDLNWEDGTGIHFDGIGIL